MHGSVILAAAALSLGGAVTVGEKHVGLGAELTLRAGLLRTGVDLSAGTELSATEASARARLGLGTDPAATLSFELTPFLGYAAYAWEVGTKPQFLELHSTSCPPYRQMRTSGEYFGAQATVRRRVGGVTLGLGVSLRRDFQPTHFEYPAGSCFTRDLLGPKKTHPGGQLDIPQSRVEISIHVEHDFWL
jgi:hypothetical protein